MVLEDGMAKGKYAPPRSVHLFKNNDVVSVSGSLNYISIVVMLIYLSEHTHPDTAFLVNCCAGYIYCPKHFNEEAFK